MVILKRFMLSLLISFALSLSSAQSAVQAPAAATGEHRKTSEPYTGDLA